MTNLIEASLSDVCVLVTDGTHDTPKRINKGYPLIKAKEIVDGTIDFDSCDHISEAEHLRVISRSKPEFGDTLFAHIGASLGEAAFVNTHRPFSIKNVALFKANPKIIDGRYLFYLVISPHFQELAKQSKTGSAQPFLSLGHLRSHRIKYHERLDEQRKISAVLSAYDDLIENNRRRISILEEIAQRIYREWFVHFRFPGHEEVEMLEVIGREPSGWEVVALEKIADVNARSIKPHSAPAKIHYINISSVSPGRVDSIDTIDFVEAPSRARRIVRDGDIIWSTVRPNRRSFALILDPEINTIVSTGFAVITAKNIPFTYLYYAITKDEFADYLTNRARGSAYPAVNAGDFRNAQILIPPAILLNKFHNVILPTINMKHTLMKKNANLQQTRDLLLPRLVSGEIDLSDLEIVMH